MEVKEINILSYNEAYARIINSIKDKHKKLRQASKGPTFCLTYGGTAKALQTIFGFSKEEALNIEARYHELYKESDEWVANKLKQAESDGYITVAFGLRVRTPKLKQSISDTKVTPKEVAGEKRTAGNACGQSYGLLNCRAANEFMSKVEDSKYKYTIRHCAAIHDSNYFLIKNDSDVLLFVNKHLLKAVSWVSPEIYYPGVPLGGELSIFYPDWAHELSLPNELGKQNLKKLVSAYLEELKNA